MDESQVDAFSQRAAAGSSASAAASGTPPSSPSRKAKKPRRPRKKKAVKKSSRRRGNQLPPPIEPAAAAPAEKPAESGLFANLFQNSSHQPSERSNGSLGGSVTSSIDPLPPEAEARLDQIPDHIGDSDPAASPRLTITEADPAADDISDVTALIEMVGAFEEQDVREELEELFAFLADRFESEHWLLTERQSRMLSRPATQMANSIWAKLRGRLPEFLAKWCESTPGAAGFLFACGVIVVPKVMTQRRLSKKAARTVTAQPQQSTAERPAPRKSPTPRPSGPSVGPIPMASGVIGGQ